MTTATQPETRISVGRHAREPYRAMIALDDSVDFDPKLRELIKIRASQLNGCAYCVDMHTRDAREGGETERRVYGVFAWHESPFFTDRERAALAVTDAMTLLSENGVPDDVWDEAARHFDETELAQLVMAITVINAWNRIGVTARMLPDDV